MTAGVRERAADQRLLELVLEPVADVALAARERLGELAIERAAPVRSPGSALAPFRAGRAPAAGPSTSDGAGRAPSR